MFIVKMERFTMDFQMVKSLQKYIRFILKKRVLNRVYRERSWVGRAVVAHQKDSFILHEMLRKL
jgi:hypothetical protein